MWTHAKVRHFTIILPVLVYDQHKAKAEVMMEWQDLHHEVVCRSQLGWVEELLMSVARTRTS